MTIDLALSVRDITLAHRTRRIGVRLRGDEVVAMENSGADLTFFEGLDQSRPIRGGTSA